MLLPLCVLALGSIVAGYAHVPHYVEAAVQPVLKEAHAPAWLHALAYVLPFFGIVPAYYLYVMFFPQAPAKLAADFLPVRRVLEAKWYFDDVYNAFARVVVVGGSASFLWKRFDAGFIDGIVNGLGTIVDGFARTGRFVQTGFVRGYALMIWARWWWSAAALGPDDVGLVDQHLRACWSSSPSSGHRPPLVRGRRG
jgi:NADH:ubiquinone oxidoreductase subunit 5 (subunit L)/multisubunit Na+/H+ antiporter MnhA subunit